MTAYNRGHFIGEAIESVLASTYTNFELIIVDDCSTDNTKSIVSSYLQKDKRISYFLNDHNLGQFANRNKAVEYSNSKYIKYLDSDDTISPIGLKVMVESILRDDEIGIGLEYFFKSPFIGNNKIPAILSPVNALKSNFEGGGLLAVGPSFCIYSKEKFLSVNGFDDSFGRNADVHLQLKLASVSKVVVFEKDLIHWRRHDGQVFHSMTDEVDMMREKFILYKDIICGDFSPLTCIEQKLYLNIQKILYSRNLFKLFLFKGKFNCFFASLSKSTISFFQLFYALVPIRFLRRS